MKSNIYDMDEQIVNLGFVKTPEGESPMFTCCFCGETFKSPDAKHTAGKIRASIDEHPQYCCPRCFEKYVVGAFSLQLMLDLDGLFPQFANIPNDTSDAFYEYLRSLSVEELSELMNDKNIRQSLSSASKLMAEIEKQNADDEAKKERSKERARERARERRAAAKAAKFATQENN